MAEKKLPARPGINTVKKMREHIEMLAKSISDRDAEIQNLREKHIQMDAGIDTILRQRDETMALLRKREEQGQEIRDALSPAYAELPLEEAVVANLDEIATRAMNAITRAQEAEAKIQELILGIEKERFILEKSVERWRRSFHILGWLFLIAAPVFMITGYECAVHFGGHTLPQGGK